MFGNAECGISSGNLLFAYMNIIEKWNKTDKLLLMPLKMKVVDKVGKVYLAYMG